jgi:hypothetical protein
MECTRALPPRHARLLVVRRVTTRLALAGVLAAPSCTDLDRPVGTRPGPVALSVSGEDVQFTTQPLGAPATYSDGSSASASSARVGAAGLAPLLSVAVAAPTADPRTIVRIYKDHDAWRSISDGGRDEASLRAMGKAKDTDYFVHPMSSLANGIPAGTRVVSITANSRGDAATSAAQRSALAQEALVAFLKTGGTLLIDLADNEPNEGYRAPGATGTPLLEMPPIPVPPVPVPVCYDATLAPAAIGPDGVAGTSDDHRFVRGPDGVIGNVDDISDIRIDMDHGPSGQQDPDWTDPTVDPDQHDSLLPKGCWIAHGDLLDHGDRGGIKLPGNARVLATATWGTEQRPVLAEYCYAGGRVVVNTFTLGFFDHKPREGLLNPVRVSHIQRNLYGYALSAEAYCNKAPTVMAPANLEVATDAGACVATILDIGDADVVDDAEGVNVVGSRSDNQALGASYPKGATSITWTATDIEGETASATQTISVKDMEKPVLSMPANQSVNTDPGLANARVDVGTASATDNCADTPVTIAFARSDGVSALDASYPVGTTTIAWTATDASGNVATADQVIVVSDAEAPSLRVAANMTVNATMPSGATVTYAAPTASDNVGVASLSCSPASGTTFPIGLNSVSCTAADAAANSTSRSFTVKVLGAPEQIVALIEYVKGAMIASPTRTLLLDYLTKVLADPRSTPYACKYLDYLMAVVRAKTGTAITTAKATRIITDATRIKKVLGCPVA